MAEHSTPFVLVVLASDAWSSFLLFLLFTPFFFEGGGGVLLALATVWADFGFLVFI